MDRRRFIATSLALPLGAALARTSAAASPLLALGDADAARPELYMGVWRSGLGNGAQWSSPAQDWAAFSATNNTHFNNGLRLAALSIYNDPQQQVKYAATWRSGMGTGAQWTVPAGSWDALWAAHQQHYSNTVKMTNIGIVNHMGQIHYTGTWQSTAGGYSQHITPAQTWPGFAADAQKWFGMGMRLASVGTAYNVNGETVYTGIWNSGAGGAQWMAPASLWTQFANNTTGYFPQGIRLAAMSVFFKSGRPRYFGVWRGGLGSGAQWVSQPAPWATFAATDKGYFDQGLRLTSIAVLRDTSVPID